MIKLERKFYKIAVFLILIFVNYIYSQEQVLYSQNNEEDKIIYSAKDSVLFDIKKNEVLLYNYAQVNYKNTELKAGFILINFNNNIIYATGIKDSLNDYTQRPILKEKGDEYISDTIKYNYKSKKATIKKLITEKDGGYLHGKEIKKENEKIYYLKNGQYTTCSLDEPHFFINSKKIKLIAGEKIITGPSNLVLADFPTPLFIPFGIFPIENQRSSGFILPTYGQSNNLGYNLRGFGYHFSINDNINLSLNSDLYSRGSWRVGIISDYKKRYKYDGNLQINFAKTKIGEIGRNDYSLSKDFKIKWTHQQDQKAHPNNQFSASVNLATSSYMQNNSYNTDYLQNTLSSNISFRRKWDNKPYNLSVNLRHTQNTLTKQVDLTIPELTFSVNRIFPFKNTIKNTWYKNLGISYTLNTKNTLSRPDSLLFSNITDNMRNGAQHSIPISTSFNLLKHININPSIRYNEKWYFKKLNTLNSDTITGFWAVRDLQYSTQLSTKIYGFLATKKKQFRHVFTPSISYTYRPDWSKDEANNLIGIYGVYNSSKQSRLSFNFNNNFEMKVNTNGEDKKIKLIESLNIGGYYDNTVDEFSMSTINIELRTQLLNKIDFKARSIIDPYAMDQDGNRLNDYLISSGKVGRLTNFNFDIGVNLNNADNKKQSDYGSKEELDYINQHLDQFVDFTVPWSLRFFYNFSYNKPQLDSELIQSINFNGDLNITDKWKIGFRSGYDIKNKDFTYTAIDVYRDLHCWEMTFNWIPLGFHQSYNFVIRVKSSILQDLKLTKKRDFYDY